MRTYEQIACVDFETYFSSEYSLRRKEYSTTSYIRDPQFKAHCVSIWLDSWPRPRVFAGDDIAQALADIDWSKTAFLAHHTHFDGLILTHHYGHVPAFWLDTMSMSSLVYGPDVKHSLEALTARLGRDGKARSAALKAVEGMRDLPPHLLKELARYNGDDVYHTMLNYRALRPAVPDSEMHVIDMTLRMYTEPTLHLNDDRVAALLDKEVSKKQSAFEAAEVSVTGPGGQERLIAKLEELGVEIPMKNSPTAAKRGEVKMVPALAKSDLEFKALQQHADPRVRALVEARVRAKSAQIETRARRVLGYAGDRLPIYLKYWAARTGRWGGGDRVNWQNLPRRGDGAELRRALLAPPGHKLIVSDASQIEARLNAWDAGQTDLLAAFASGQDVYIITAAGIYGVDPSEITDDQRFVGKVFVLGGGYGAGHVKLNYMFKLGQFGPPLVMPLEQTKELLDRWRHVNHMIVKKWKQNEQDAKHAFLNETTVESGCVTYQGFMGEGFMHAPNGTYIRYPDVRYDQETRQMLYHAKTGPVKLYGGILTENKIQKLARHVLAHHLLQMEEQLPDARVAALVHDEVVLVVPDCRAEEYAQMVKKIMSTPPDWTPGLPLDAKVNVFAFYDKS